MDAENPLVSIIIPVYNGANFLSNAIQSAINQTYKNTEIIVVNDGSTDKTEEIALSFGDKIRYFKKENGGVSSALNYGIKHMSGTYFSWLSHDDLYLPDKIAVEISTIKNHNKPSIVFSNFYLINEEGDITAETHFETQYEQKLFSKNLYPALRGCINGDTILIHKDIFTQYGLFDETLATSGDSDLWLRIFPHFRHYFIKEPLIKYRIHPEQDTQKHPKYLSQSDDIAVQKIKTLTHDIAKQWGYSLFRLYMELYIQFKNVGLPNSTQLAYKLGRKEFSKAKPTFSIILPQTTPDFINTLINSNFPDFEVFVHDENIIPDDFRFRNLKSGHITDDDFTKKAIAKSTGNYILIISTNTQIHVDWLQEKYHYFNSIIQKNFPVIIFENSYINTIEITTNAQTPSKTNAIKSALNKNISRARSLLKATAKKMSTKQPNIKNTIFFSTATDDYIPKSITSLLSIRRYLPKAKLCIISRNISPSNRNLLKEHKINFVDIDLRGKFNRHWQYPTECFYIFAGPELFFEQNYAYSVYIDGDILCCSDPIKNIPTINGVAGTVVGNCKGVFLEDYEKLKSLFQLTPEQITRNRIASGIVYFNNEKMHKLHLLDAASSLFKKCLENHIPRKGDDSLFTLFQLLYLSPNDMVNLNYSYNYMPTIFGQNLPKHIVFLHFAEHKPWSEYDAAASSIKAFMNQWLSIYNTIPTSHETNLYPIQRSQLYPNDKYIKNQLKPPLKVFVSENKNLGIFNFGDELPKDIIPNIFGYQIEPVTNINEADLLSIGSILFELPNLKKRKTIKCWGSGFISEEPIQNENTHLQQVTFSAVRGYETLARIQKVIGNQHIALGDPGILANLIYPSNPHKTKKIGIIPHYVDADNDIVEKLRTDNRFLIIDPLDSPSKVAQEISSCKYIISSSLHGIIIADSYNIPNAHVKFSNKVYGGEYKFKDYDSAFNKKHLDIDSDKLMSIDYINELMKEYQPIINLKQHQQKLIDAFPF